MKQVFLICFVLLLLSSCSKKEDCYCNVGDGEYSYLPPSNQVQDPGTSVNTFGDLEEECTLQDGYLKANSSSDAYCEMK